MIAYAWFTTRRAVEARQGTPADRGRTDACGSHGDDGDPARIHDADMPGLAPLRAAPRHAVRTDDRALPEGGEITFQAGEPKLVDILHAWFDARGSDHGHDAVMRHDPSMMDMRHRA